MAGPWEEFAPQASEAKPWEEFAAPKRYGSGKSFDVMEDGSLAPTESVHYTGSGVVPSSSGIAERERKYGTKAGFDFGVKKEDVRDVRMSLASPVRGAIKGVAALPTMASDFGVGTRNLLTGSNYELPSQMYERAFDTALPQHNLKSSKAMEFGTSILAGSVMPVPQVKNPAPAGFQKPAADLVRQQTLADGRRVGYVVPPATTNPSGANTFLESFGGKIATAQDAAIKNQEITNMLAKRAIGISDDTPLTLESLKAIRREAGENYETLRNAGMVMIDDASSKSLDALSSKFTGNNIKDAIGGGNDIAKIVAAIKSNPLNGDTAVDAMALLRDKADVAYRGGEKELGKAYKQISKIIEDLMEKKLSGEALSRFKGARELIAKTYSVESAFNQATGNVVSNKLASQLGKGKPLSGDLKLAARFGQAFPKASREMVDSGAVRHTDAVLASGATVFSGQPWYLGWPFLRQGARSFLLSNAGQGMATPGQTAQLPPELAQALMVAAQQGQQSAGQQ